MKELWEIEQWPSWIIGKIEMKKTIHDEDVQFESNDKMKIINVTYNTQLIFDNKNTNAMSSKL